MAQRIPLCRRDGTIRAWAVVDDVDYDEVAAHRWHLSASGYAVRNVRTAEGRFRTVAMARWLCRLDAGDGRHVDHRNRDRLDNRRCNLRVVTPAHNRANRKFTG